MMATNHMLAGALIATAIDRPLIAIPVAFLSHLVLDSLPHFGFEVGGFGNALKSALTTFMLLFDAFAFMFLAALLWSQPLLVSVCAFAAASPDGVWFLRYFLFERVGKKPWPNDSFTRFHAWVQWCERPWGVFVEVAAFATLFTIFASRIS